MSAPKATLFFEIDDSFFSSKDYSSIHKGELICRVTISKKAHEGEFNVTLHIEGKLMVQCMHCNDEMYVPVKTETEISVKLVDSYQEDDADCVNVLAEDGILDIEPLIYDYSLLALPSRYVHPEGECNEEMAVALSKYLVTDLKQEDELED